MNEVKLLGANTVKIDKNKRINIPKFSNIQADDKLVSRVDPSGNFVIFYPEEYFEEKSKEIEEELHQDVLNGELTSEEKRKILRSIGSSFIPPIKVDSHRRISLDPEIFEKLKLGRDLYLIANDNNTLELYKDEDTYKRIKS